MIDFVIEHGVVVVGIVGGLAGGLAGVLVVIVYWQHNAVDRLVDVIENTKPLEHESWRQGLKNQTRFLGLIHTHRPTSDPRNWQDAPGIVIARSVRRVTKEKP